MHKRINAFVLLGVFISSGLYACGYESGDHDDKNANSSPSSLSYEGFQAKKLCSFSDDKELVKYVNITKKLPTDNFYTGLQPDSSMQKQNKKSRSVGKYLKGAAVCLNSKSLFNLGKK